MKAHKLWSQSSITWTFMMSVMRRKMTKSVSEKWSELFSIDSVCPPSGVYQLWPWSSSAILYVPRERAAHFSDSTHDQRPKKKTCYISTAGRDCGWSVFKEGLDHTYCKKGRNILLHRLNRSLVSDCPESVQHSRFIWGSLVRFCSVNAAPCAPKKISVQEISTLTSVHMHPTGPIM